MWHWRVAIEVQTANSSCPPPPKKKREWVDSLRRENYGDSQTNRWIKALVRLISWDWNARSFRHASPRVRFPKHVNPTGRLSPQSSDNGPQEERSGQNASSRLTQNRQFQVQLSHSRAPRPIEEALPYRCPSTFKRPDRTSVKRKFCVSYFINS